MPKPCMMECEMRRLLLTAIASSALTYMVLAAQNNASQKNNRSMKFENKRVRVSEIVYEPGVPRERYTRPTDQVIVFLDDCKYQRIDSKTGEKTVRERKSGEIIWHDKGEDAPVLINAGSKAYRTLLIELP
jgi:hypothetical protein